MGFGERQLAPRNKVTRDSADGFEFNAALAITGKGTRPGPALGSVANTNDNCSPNIAATVFEHTLSGRRRYRLKTANQECRAYM